MATPPKLQSSFSSNDVPTVKNQAGMNNAANNHAQQHFHNHNASIGRIPTGAMPPRHSREMSNDSAVNGNREQANSTYQSIQSALQASAPPFGPSTTAAAPHTSAAAVSSPPATAPANSFPNFYPTNGYGAPNGHNGAGNNYGMQMLTNNMQQMGLNGVNAGNMYPSQNYAGYGSMPYNQNNAPRDSQARVIQHRRQLDNEGMSSPLMLTSFNC